MNNIMSTDPREIVRVNLRIMRGDRATDVTHCMPLWHVAASRVLIGTRLDGGGYLRAIRAFHARAIRGAQGKLLVQPGDLGTCAQRLYNHAGACRTLRWRGKAPPRLPADAAWSLDDTPSILETIGLAKDLANARHDGTVQARTTPDVIGLFMRAANVAPRTESGLASEGFTVGELVTASLAGLGREAAEELDAIFPQESAALHDARVFFEEATRRLEDGVSYTLQRAGRPRWTLLQQLAEADAVPETMGQCLSEGAWL